MEQSSKTQPRAQQLSRRAFIGIAKTHADLQIADWVWLCTRKACYRQTGDTVFRKDYRSALHHNCMVKPKSPKKQRKLHLFA